MFCSKQEIAAFKARKAMYDGSDGRVDDFVCQNQSKVSLSRSSVEKKWKPTPTVENARSDDWLGSPATKKRSWKVKAIKTAMPDPDAEE
jgi:hypothetical protein